MAAQVRKHGPIKVPDTPNSLEDVCAVICGQNEELRMQMKRKLPEANCKDRVRKALCLDDDWMRCRIPNSHVNVKEEAINYEDMVNYFIFDCCKNIYKLLCSVA